MAMFNPKKYTLVYEGSSKNKLRDKHGNLIFHFLPFFSAFDVGRHRQQIPGKAEAICACAVRSAEIARALGVPTCFKEQIADDAIIVHEAQIIADRNPTLKDENYVLPVELIDRHRVAGSFLRKFKSGELKPEAYGLPAGVVPAPGTPFPFPVEHTTTKFELTDRTIDWEEACLIGGVRSSELRNSWNMIHRAKSAMHLVCLLGGYGVLDGKTEVIIGPGRLLMFGDVQLTPDEDRPVPLKELAEGILVHHNKEFLREFLINIGYYAEVKAARAAGKKDPPYPLLPEEIVAETARRYKAFADSYTSVDLKALPLAA